jgi:hypothetical protein
VALVKLHEDVKKWPEAAKQALQERICIMSEGPKASSWSPEYLQREAERVTRKDWEGYS